MLKHTTFAINWNQMTSIFNKSKVESSKLREQKDYQGWDVVGRMKYILIGSYVM